MLRVDKETLFYPLNANTEKIKFLFIHLKPPLSKVLKFFASIFLKYCLVTVVLPGKHQNNFRETWRDHRRLTLKGIPPSDLNIYYSTENPTRPCTFDRRKSRSVSFWILWPRRPGKKPCRCNEPHRFREKLLSDIYSDYIEFPGKLPTCSVLRTWSRFSVISRWISENEVNSKKVCQRYYL